MPDHALRPLLLALQWDTAGGLNRYVHDLLSAMADAGIPARAIMLATDAPVPAGVVTAASGTAPLPTRLRGYSRAAGQEAAKADVVDVHFALFAWWPVTRGSLRRLPLVVHFHGPWAAESRTQGAGRLIAQAKRALERSVYSRADRLIVLSHAFGQLLVAEYGVAPWRIRVVRPGVDLVRFAPDKAGARARLGIAPDAAVVVTARRLVPRMGLDVLLMAWGEIVTQHGDGARLLIAGEGPLDEQLRRSIVALGLQDTVTMLGRVSEEHLVDLNRAADIAVLPSLALEGFGLAAVEALACGTPVVLTDVGGLPDVVEGLDRDLVVPAGDSAALAARLLRGLDGEVPDASRCRAHAETFTWAASVEHHREVYAEARAESAAPGAAQFERRLRVVYLDHCGLLSGGEIALSRLLAGLHDVDAHVLLGEQGPLVQLLQDQGVSVDVRPLPGGAGAVRRDELRPGLRVLRSAAETGVHVVRLARHLRRLQPDVVHTNSLKSALYGSVAGRIAGVPVVWHARDRVAEDYLPPAAVHLVRLAAARLPTQIVANSEVTLASLRLPGHRSPSAVVVHDPYSRARPSAAAGAPGGCLRIGMVGRLSSWKGQDVFLKAFALVHREGLDRAVLVGSAMFGEEEYEAHLRRLVDELGLGGSVDFLGFKTDVESVLDGLDVLVHASTIPEPFGQVIVEGMAAGLPVIASTEGGPAEIITHDVDGLLVPPRDAEGLAVALRRLLVDDALRRRLGQAAQARAGDFHPRVIEPQMMSVYEGLRR